MTAPTNPGKTPFFNFLAFFIAFGWEGPVVINIGLEHHSNLEIGMGLFFLVVFWGLFGVRLLYALIRHVQTRKYPASLYSQFNMRGEVTEMTGAVRKSGQSMYQFFF